MTDGVVLVVMGISLLIAIGFLSVLVVVLPTSEEFGEFLRKHHLPPRRH
jgi:hypothetical protein